MKIRFATLVCSTSIQDWPLSPNGTMKHSRANTVHLCCLTRDPKERNSTHGTLCGGLKCFKTWVFPMKLEKSQSYTIRRHQTSMAHGPSRYLLISPIGLLLPSWPRKWSATSSRIFSAIPSVTHLVSALSWRNWRLPEKRRWSSKLASAAKD